MTLDDIERALVPSGLMLRGAFHPRPGDEVPPLPDGAPVGTLVLVGNAGPSMWRAFVASGADRDAPHALDRWTELVLRVAASALGAHVLFPFGAPPWLPFQRWALSAEPVSPSPIGPLIHPDYGLWHAYRGAFAFKDALEFEAPDKRPSPCETCADKPCLEACPVGAFAPGAYDVPVCLDHVTGEEGRDCTEESCRARRACPVGRDYVYGPEQSAFHMRAFVRAHRGAR